jgi:hypothetical protein
MKKVFVYVLEYSEWKNRSQLEFSNLTFGTAFRLPLTGV